LGQDLKDWSLVPMFANDRDFASVDAFTKPSVSVVILLLDGVIKRCLLS